MDVKKIETFINGCLRKQCGFLWPDKITTLKQEKTKRKNIITERRRRQLLRNVLQMEADDISKVAFRWTLSDKIYLTCRDAQHFVSGRESMEGACCGLMCHRGQGRLALLH